MATRANTERTPTRRARRAVWMLALCCLPLLLAPALRADTTPAAFVLIVHPDNPTSAAPRDFVSQAFLKTITRWQNGELIRPVDLAPESATRALFSERVLKRSVMAIRNYWQQRIFSGRDLPPPELEADAAVIAFVARNRGAIGYVSGSAKLDGVKVLAVK